jgi:hypothetical protein
MLLLRKAVIHIYVYPNGTGLYREDFNSIHEFTALRFIAAGVLPAMRCI